METSTLADRMIDPEMFARTDRTQWHFGPTNICASEWDLHRHTHTRARANGTLSTHVHICVRCFQCKRMKMGSITLQLECSRRSYLSWSVISDHKSNDLAPNNMRQTLALPPHDSLIDATSSYHGTRAWMWSFSLICLSFCPTCRMTLCHVCESWKSTNFSTSKW